MATKERKISERSLENLKLGAQARYQGKARHNFTVLPETVEWLKATGNASDTIDALVEAARNGGLTSKSTHNWKDKEQVVSSDTYKRISQLEKENEQLRSDLQDLEAQHKELRYQAGQADVLAVEWQQKKKALTELLAKVDSKQKGYLSNSFGQGIKEIRDLLA
jgi:predicted RNase H-like nuclease (RuvC/YqgF family)